MLHSRKKKSKATKKSKSNSCEAAPLQCVQSLEHRKHGVLGKQGKHPWDQNPQRKENDKALQYHSACELSTKKTIQCPGPADSISKSCPDEAIGARCAATADEPISDCWSLGTCALYGENKGKTKQTGKGRHHYYYYYILVFKPSWWVCEISMRFFFQMQLFQKLVRLMCWLCTSIWRLSIFSITFAAWRVYKFLMYFQVHDLMVMMLVDMTERNVETQRGEGGQGDPWEEKSQKKKPTTHLVCKWDSGHTEKLEEVGLFNLPILNCYKSHEQFKKHIPILKVALILLRFFSS